ncbi:metallophosphoesterase [Paenibacillus sp. BSR1-1]|uniref:metallophosphoesterase n=1 Tax=Paenibacillus sp. BSR1-1 TaxID=3020845 RepID=UPI0025AEE158|nr:metallophosphoesterase [Paenibacillus sp. BSR1-1]MDN3017765.1 metallophosphoesterase [Paenibacillus sp. BSR1-1]
MKKVSIFLSTAVITGLLFTPKPAAAFSQPNLQLSVMSDVHINKDMPSNKFENALNDLNRVAPRYDAIAVVGDFTDAGYEEEYQTFTNLLKTYKNPLAESIISIGNHEYRETIVDPASPVTDDELKARFMHYNGDPITKVYFDKWIKGYHFISLGGELSPKSLSPYEVSNPGARDWAYISEEQYQWLEQTLPVNAASNKPIFVLLHQPIANTVYGSDRYNAGFDNQRLLAILKKYPQAILISGHTHYLLNHPKSIYQDGFTMVNTSSVASTWYDGGSVPTLSQGYVINVYDDRVEFKAREFSNGTWIRTETIPIPFKETTKDVSKPSFPASAKTGISTIGTTNAAFTWDRGKDDTVVDRYVIKKDGQLVKTVYSRYWEPEETLSLSVNNLFPNTTYTYEVFAVDAYDHVSDNPLKITFTTQSVTGWYHYNNTLYYFNKDGVKQIGWLQLNSQWYYFNPAGAMLTGWNFINGKWYFFKEQGEMSTGWMKEGTSWYFFDSNGSMHTGWLFTGGKWYYLDSHGVMKTGWISAQKNWYYLDEKGVMLTGWLQLANQWYYLKSNGVMAVNWQFISGKWYYFLLNGQLKK